MRSRRTRKRVSVSEREERVARNEAMFRVANERLRDDLEEFSLGDGLVAFICECGNPRCTSLAQLTLGEYEAVRGNPARFLVLPDHAMDFEDVVERHDNFSVVEKTAPKARQIVEESDPRTGASAS